MAKSIPTVYAPTSPQRLATGQIVFLSDWQSIFEGQNFHFSRSAGFIALGKSFEPLETTTSGTFSSVQDGQWAADFHRLTNLTGSLRYRIWMVIIGEQIDVRLNIRDPGGTNTTTTATKTGAGFGRATATALGFSSGAGPKTFDLEIRQNTGGAGTGSLAQVLIREEPITNPIFLPTGR